MDELLEQRRKLARQLKVGDRYQHYKNRHFYRIHSLALREEDDSWSVNYADEISGVIFNRRVEVFLAKVLGENGEMVSRFKKVKEGK